MHLCKIINFFIEYFRIIIIYISLIAPETPCTVCTVLWRILHSIIKHDNNNNNYNISYWLTVREYLCTTTLAAYLRWRGSRVYVCALSLVHAACMRVNASQRTKRRKNNAAQRHLCTFTLGIYVSVPCMRAHMHAVVTESLKLQSNRMRCIFFNLHSRFIAAIANIIIIMFVLCRLRCSGKNDANI